MGSTTSKLQWDPCICGIIMESYRFQTGGCWPAALRALLRLGFLPERPQKEAAVCSLGSVKNINQHSLYQRRKIKEISGNMGELREGVQELQLSSIVKVLKMFWRCWSRVMSRTEAMPSYFRGRPRPIQTVRCLRCLQAAHSCTLLGSSLHWSIALNEVLVLCEEYQAKTLFLSLPPATYYDQLRPKHWYHKNWRRERCNVNVHVNVTVHVYVHHVVVIIVAACVLVCLFGWLFVVGCWLSFVVGFWLLVVGCCLLLLLLLLLLVVVVVVVVVVVLFDCEYSYDLWHYSYSLTFLKFTLALSTYRYVDMSYRQRVCLCLCVILS